MKARKIAVTLLALVLTTSLFAGCKKSATDETKQSEKTAEQTEKTDSSAQKKVLDYYVADEPETLDAQKLSGQPDMFLVNMFVEGLTRFGKEEGKYEPGVAKEWKYDETTNSWTFTLRDDAKWSNGEKVTPADFFFSWRRALEEQTVYSFMISDYIKGADEYAATTKISYLAEKDAAFKALVEKRAAEKDAEKKKDIDS
jgi:ABC-type oligopeptide transport system, periplasmic component